MSSGISTSNLIHNSSLATIRFITQPNQISPIRVLDSATYSDITPKILFQSQNQNNELERIKQNVCRSNGNRQFDSNSKPVYFSLMEHQQMCESFELQPNQLKSNNQNKEQFYEQQPQIYEANSNHLQHMIQLFSQSSIYPIQQQQSHHLSSRFYQLHRFDEERLQDNQQSGVYAYALQQLKLMSKNIQTINQLFGNIDKENREYQSSLLSQNNIDHIGITNNPFIISVQPVINSHQQLKIIEAKSTKSQQMKNNGAECQKTISQFRNIFNINKQDLSDLSPISKMNKLKNQKHFNTSQNSSKMLMRRKMNHTHHFSKDLFSA